MRARVPFLLLLTLPTAACRPAAGPSGRDAGPRAMLPFQNSALALEERVQDLIARLTLDEKVSQLRHESAAIPRLGIPAYDWWNEGLHGVARAGRATVFPQAIGLAATWDTDLLHRVATTVSDEARAKHHEAARQGRRGIYEGLTFWSPNINIFRDPRWGRGMETYGEDPFLAGRLAVSFVRGMQGDHPRYLKTVATPKHYAVHSGPEPDRHRFDAVVSQADLWGTYLPHFADAIVHGAAASIMCAYNRVYGDPACASPLLLQEILRDRWGFEGYVVSDCWAISDFHSFHGVAADEVEAAAQALRAGTDLSCGPEYRSLVEAVRRGLVTVAQVDTALARLLRARFRLGMFDPPELVPWAWAADTLPSAVALIDLPAHRALAREAARKSIVLLTNDGVLPLRKDLKTIAVIGPNADDVDVLLGNYNGLPTAPVTPLQGIRAAVGPGTTVVYARGSDVAQGMPTLRVMPAAVLRDLRGAYHAGHGLPGTPAALRADSAVDFTWWDAAPADGVPADSFSVRWTGTLVPPAAGRYALGLRALGGARLFLDDSLLVEFSDRHVVLTQWAMVDLGAGDARALRVEYFDRRADAIVQLVWAPPDPRPLDDALAAARRADVVVMMLGLSPRLEGEEMPVDVPGFAGGDRVTLGLPATQDSLLRAVVATGTPVVLVLLNGSALALPWAAEHVAAVVEAWYPGQEAGTALADVLFGDVSPGGRLPVTVYRSVDDLPAFDDYRMQGRTYRYFAGEPLFPFGHGLSYARFRYHDLRLPSRVPAGDSVRVSVEVENTGTMTADEVVQLYVSDVEAPVAVPLRSLQGFQRVTLRPGERRRVTFTLAPRQLAFVDADGRYVVESGAFVVSVGGKQPGFRGTADATTTEVLEGRLGVAGPRRVLDGR